MRWRDPLEVGIQVYDLAPQMHGQSSELQLGVRRDELGCWKHLIGRETELDPALAGGDVGMGIGGDVRIDPNADLHPLRLRLGDPSQQLELLAGFHIEMPDAGLDCGLQLAGRLPYSTEHDLVGGEAGSQHAGQLPRGDDVHSRAQLPQKSEHREVAVGLDGVADPVRQAGQGAIEGTVSFPNGFRVVHVSRGSGSVGNLNQRDATHGENAPLPLQPRVSKELRLVVGAAAALAGCPAQYAFAHTASAMLGRLHHKQVVGATGERNSSSGSTRMVALVCSLISVSQVVEPQ